MKDRISRFIEAEGITRAAFADKLGVSRSSLTHILSGRNSPGYDFIINMLSQYPSLSSEWLLRGKGKMYRSDAQCVEELSPEANIQISETLKESEEPLLFPSEEIENLITGTQNADYHESAETNHIGENGDFPCAKNRGRKVRHVIILFDDNSFQVL